MKISRLDFIKGLGALFALPLLGKLPKEEKPEIPNDQLHSEHLKVHEDFCKYKPVYLPEVYGDHIIKDYSENYNWEIDRATYKWWQPESYNTYTTTTTASALTLDNLATVYKRINTT